MNRDDILRMTRESKLCYICGFNPESQFVFAGLKAFAKLVAAAEREACARMAEDCVNIEKLADDIRAREDMRENLRDMMDEVRRDWPATKQTLGG